MDKQKASQLLAILAPLLLIGAAVVGIYFRQAGIWVIGGVIIFLAIIGSLLKR